MVAAVAIDEAWGIGRDGQLLCPIRADLKRFKEMTWGHTVILGRKTLATFPGGKPLPGRTNIVLSRQPDLEIPGAVVAGGVEEVLRLAPPDSFVIGGGSVYEAFLPYCDRVEATRIFRTFPADTRFPVLDPAEWEITAESPVLEEDGVRFCYTTFRRKKEDGYGS